MQLGMTTKIVAAIFAVVAIALGFTAIFEPWYYLDYYEIGSGDHVITKIYLYRAHEEVWSGNNYQSFNRNLYSRIDDVCNNEDIAACTTWTRIYQVSSATIGLIVGTMAFAIIFAVMAWTKFGKGGGASLVLALTIAMACVAIIIYPTGVPPFTQTTANQQTMAFYAGFWVWLITALLSIWVGVCFISDSGNEHESIA